jgi:diacylglycerol kinase (ATP)
MENVLVVVNPYAGSGSVGYVWDSLQPTMAALFPQMQVAFTESVPALHEAIQKAHTDGIRRVIALGGDGTNHAVVNGIMALPQPQSITYGVLPMGTGCDWARMAGIPMRPLDAAHWLARHAQPKAVDVVAINYHLAEDRPMPQQGMEYFLNIGGVGVNGEVAVLVNQQAKRSKLAFLLAAIRVLRTCQAMPLRVLTDDHTLYDGLSYVAIAANGTTFGNGMKAAPHAKVDDGILEVVVSKQVSKAKLLLLLGKLYTGTHLNDPDVVLGRGKTVEIECPQGAIIEMDGEHITGIIRLRMVVHPAALNVLF